MQRLLLLFIMKTTRKEEIYTVNYFLRRDVQIHLSLLSLKYITTEVLEHSHTQRICIKLYYFNFFARLHKQNTIFYEYCNSQISFLVCFVPFKMWHMKVFNYFVARMILCLESIWNIHIPNT